MKLPPGSTRTWNHVVDARSGPGLKSMTRNKKRSRENADSDADKTPVKKKHVYKRKPGKETTRAGTPEAVVVARSEARTEARADKRKQNRAAIRRRNPAEKIEGVCEFAGSAYWTK